MCRARTDRDLTHDHAASSRLLGQLQQKAMDRTRYGRELNQQKPSYRGIGLGEM